MAQSDNRWAIRFGSALVPVAHAAGQNVVTVLGLRFMTDSLAISAGTAGLIFALVKIYDGLLDPAVGAWSDRAQTRWGRRLPFLFVGGLAMPLGVAMLFGAPDFGSVLLAELFVTLALIIHASGYTLLTIPGFAMVVESSPDHHERTRLMAWRVYGNAIGTLIGTTLPGLILGRLGAGRGAHLAMALAIGAVVLLATLLAVRLLIKAPRSLPPAHPRPFNLPAQAKLAWANQPFRLLAITHVFLLFGTAIGSAAMAYFSRYVLQAPDGWIATYFLFATVGMVGSIPAWVWVTGVIGKKAGYMTAMALYGLVSLSWLTASPLDAAWLSSARALLSGLAGGGTILCAYAMLSDAVRYDYVCSGERREGVFAGLTTLLDKLSSAAALAAMGAFLSAMGYVSSTMGGTVAQSAQAVRAVALCVGAVPALAMLCGVIAVSRYKLDPASLIEPSSGEGA
ncbi:MFS transporter [Novosphingobium umbonatum]|uniref:MFS transporter n=1 Tax=Novosphingobium umbonatum TaxID=1908524 RepID=A0A3S2UV39_9SPHN|nr:MFS transporter [Novosphingobium umbonatum]RVU05832.1 MFS transporter [Novosphingobium umbonatum]